MTPLGLRLGLGSGGGVGSPYSAEAEAYFAAMTTQGDAIYKTWLDTFIVKLQTDLLWTKIKAAWIFANNVKTSTLINLKDPAGTKLAYLNDTEANSIFTAYEGWNPNANSRGFNTQVFASNIFTSAINMGISIYSRSNISQAANLAGCSDGSRIIAILPRNSTNNQQNILSTGVSIAAAWDAGTADSSGLHTVQSETDNNTVSYRNGTKYKTTSISGRATIAKDLYIGCYNNNGVVSNATDRQISIAICHDTLTTGSGSELEKLATDISWLLQNTPAGDKRVA